MKHLREINKEIIGQAITDIGFLDAVNTKKMYLQTPPIIITLANNTQLMVMSDAEGNDVGSLHCYLPDNKFIIL